MAKWGEGDPRWIVEERADGCNVNNWHWSEKNATPWSKDKIKSLLVGLKIEDEEHSCEIVELTKCDGEATANNRKAKLIFFYEFELTGEWKGSFKNGDKIHRGKFLIPNLSEENTADDIDVNITVDKECTESYQLKQFMHKTGQKIIKDRIGEYIKDLTEEFSKGLILPTDGSANTAKSKPKSTQENVVKKQLNQAVNQSSKSSHQTVKGVRIKCKKFSQKIEFMCQAGDLYRALTERQMVCAFTRGDAEIEADKGAKFRLFNGSVTGTFTELNFNESIGMRWRFESWPAEHYSEVKITFDQKDCTTDLILEQSGIPENEYDKTSEGWERYYWQPIKATFGFGASLY